MKHEERVVRMREGYRVLVEKLSQYSSSSSKLPDNIEKGKLEELYDNIDKNYEWVLRKRASAQN
jgi:hypothetical protein